MVQWDLAAVCLVWKDVDKGEVLLIKRHVGNPLELSGKWFFPGGSVEAGEALHVAAARETEEETGVRVKGVNLLAVHPAKETWTIKGKRETKHVVIVFYEGIFAGGQLVRTTEAVDLKWAKKGEVGKYVDKNVSKSHVPYKVRRFLLLGK